MKYLFSTEGQKLSMACTESYTVYNHYFRKDNMVFHTLYTELQSENRIHIFCKLVDGEIIYTVDSRYDVYVAIPKELKIVEPKLILQLVDTEFTLGIIENI